MKDFNKALSNLKASSPKEQGWRKAERDVREKSRQVSKIDEEEEHDARRKLHGKGKAQQDEVRQSYHAAQEAIKNLMKDRARLETAQRHAGVKEAEYEKEEMANEFFAEHSQDYAERQQEQASEAVENIMERAEDHLLQEQHRNSKREVAAQHRHEAIRGALESMYKTAEADKKEDKTFSAPEAQLASLKNSLEGLKSGIDAKSSPSVQLASAAPSPFVGLCLLAVASSGLLVAFYLRISTKPTPIAQPLLP